MDAPFTTHPECPSELRLDRLHLGELEREDANLIRGHVASCTRCTERVVFRERGLGAFSGVDPARMIAAIETKLGANIGAPVKKKDRARWLPIAASATVAVVAIAVMYPREPIDDVRAKGDLGLTIFRERAGKVDRVAAGDRVRAKDRLRFGVSVPDTNQEIMIVSVEAGGKIFTYYPSDGTMRSRAPLVTEDGALEGAIELDASPSDEQIHLVACKKPFALADLKTGRSPDLLDIPKDCAETSLSVKKEGAP